MSTKIALVTGGNRGIGLAICRQLAQSGLQVILGSRSLEKGQMAVQDLRQEGLELTALELDLNQPASIQNAAASIQTQFGRLEVLVNNAGVMLGRQRNQNSVFDLQIETLQDTLRPNLYGPLELIQAVIPMMQTQGYGRIVNMSSGLGQLQNMGGGYAAYRLSKTALNALTRIVAAEIQHPNIKINTMCPGWVRTDMGGPQAARSPEQGADTACWLATLPEEGPSGLFFRDRQVIDW